MPNAQKFTELDQVKAKLAISEARVAELEARLERAKESVELHDFFTTYDILHEPITN